MANPFFSFKQFTVYHNKCAMKVGIDGVLLGAWVSIENAKTILDIGTGTGLISLMLAQRSNADIHAIDIDKNAIEQALENTNNSPWKNKITLYEKSLQKFADVCLTKFDLIVSNPPYFVNSLKTPVESRTIARHTDSLTHEELLLLAKKLLTKTGRICIILPVLEGNKCIKFALEQKMYCSKKINVYPKPNTDANRVLLEFCLIPIQMFESSFPIESSERHHYSSEFALMAKDYYLKL